MMDDYTIYPSLPEMPISNEEMFSFDTNNLNFQTLNTQTLIHNFDGVIMNQNLANGVFDINEYCFTMPMENGRVVDLNLPQTPEKDKENDETCTTGSVKSSPTGIMPCQDEFGGEFDFEVMLDANSECYRQKWFYSVKLQKIFIDINKVLLLNFKYDFEKISKDIPLFVRAMPMYSAADWMKEPVDRCLQHLSPVNKINKDFIHLEHVLRCDNEYTTYHKDQISKRKSITTRLARPQHGADSIRLSYRFVCKTSCLSGMQRRPIVVIFTLEDNIGQVLGRCVLPVKICSCPKRDMEREEDDTKLKKNTVFRRTKKCISQKNHHHHHHHNNNNNNNDDSQPSNIIKTESSDMETEDYAYTLPISYKTNSKKNYKRILELVYSVVQGASTLHNDMQDTEPLLKDLKSRLDELK